MIKRFKSIRCFGIFQNFTASNDLKDFVRFNLFYGWNGSGKTTFSRLLHALESKQVPTEAKACEFELLLNDGSAIKQNSLDKFSEKIFVFNQQFIEENIDWKKQGTKVIVTISEEKIEERNKFFEIKDKRLPITEQLLSHAKDTLLRTEKERDDFLTSLARSVKQSFQLIDTKDSRYMNYDRGKLRPFIENNLEYLQKTTSILSKKDLEEIAKKVRPVHMNEIVWEVPFVNKNMIIEATSKAQTLLKTSIVSKTIARLQENVKLNVWVKEGLELHSELDSSECEFCGQPLLPNRVKELENHFNKDYIDLLEKLNNAKNWFEGLKIQMDALDGSSLYEEFQQNYKTENEKNKVIEDKLTHLFIDLIGKLKQKIANPFTIIELELGLTEQLNELEKHRNEILKIINAHNDKSKNFEAELQKHKQVLELHYVADGIKDKKYFELLKKINEIKESVDSYQNKLDKLLVEKNTLEANLANVAKGADDFNSALHLFLGRNDIKLRYDSREKAYKIMRGEPAVAAQNLSEGEKTAIAFIFFVNKLYENGNKIDDSIVVIDDPISSFDVNHLFHSFAYLKRNCEQAKQLFVLTHNFHYFKIIREWLLAKNKKPDVIKSRIFTIEVAKGTRNSTINNCHESLLRFGSEYQYLFKKLLDFQNEESLNIESAYQVANYSRKLLEGFFKFKLPKDRDNFYQLMEAGCKINNVEKEDMDKVYKFINKYSHNEAIEFHDSIVDNLLGEGENITKQVLRIIKKCDEIHFTELMEVCQN